MNTALRYLPVLLWLQSEAALACGPDPCWDTDGCLEFSASNLIDFTGCTVINRPFLDVGNDTRGNLALLFAQASGNPVEQEPGWKEYEEARDKSRVVFQAALLDAGVKQAASRVSGGELYPDSHCHSNNYETATSFVNAVKEELPTSPARSHLSSLRNHLLNYCGVKPDDPAYTEYVNALNAYPEASEFGRYLAGIRDFYSSKFDESVATAESLFEAKSPWVREAAWMLTIRAHLLKAQSTWNGYDDKSVIIRDSLNKSDAAIDSYLKKFPQGVYKKSVEGLKRRVAWLGLDRARYDQMLTSSIATAIAEKWSLDRIWPLINEIEQTQPYLQQALAAGVSKTQFTFYDKDPLISAVGVLASLRRRNTPLNEFSKKELAARDSFYGPFPGLKDFLLAAVAKSDERWNEALAYAQKAAKESGLIGTSAKVIVAEALEALNDHEQAEKEWLQLLAIHKIDKERRYFEIALLRIAIKTGQTKWVEDLHSPVSVDVAKQALKLLTIKQLESAISKVPRPALRTSLLEKLLLRYILTKDWSSFLKVYRQQTPTDRSFFAPVETAVRSLSENPDDAKGLFNLGYFLQEKGPLIMDVQLCRSSTSLDSQVASVLPENQAKAPGNTDDPTMYYQSAMGKTNDRELKAKIIAHAILCFKPGSASFGCHFNPKSSEISQVTRQSWFNTLKKELKGTTWEKKTSYFY